MEKTNKWGKNIEEISNETKLGPQLTMDEIKKKYKSGYVVLGNCRFNVVAGEVMFHTEDEAECKKKLNELGPSSEAHSYYSVLNLGNKDS